jgi:hypothetical protein
MPSLELEHGMSERSQLRGQLNKLLNNLGSTDADIAATLSFAGVKGIPGSSRDSAMARYLNAVVAFDPRVAAVSVTSTRIAVACRHWWVRDLIMPTPPSVSSFLVRFDRRDFADLLASPVDPRHFPESDSD